MKTSVRRWGNSLALRIPSAYATETQLCEGSEVELTLQSGNLIVAPVRRKRRELSTLLRKITPRNIHGAVSTGRPVGREVWS